jgi:hypothetical protein
MCFVSLSFDCLDEVLLHGTKLTSVTTYLEVLSLTSTSFVVIALFSNKFFAVGAVMF